MDFEKDTKIYQQIKPKFRPEKGQGIVIALDHEDLNQCSKYLYHSVHELIDIGDLLIEKNLSRVIFDYLEKYPIMTSVFESFTKEENLITGRILSFNKKREIDMFEVARQFRELEAFLKQANSKAS